VLYSQITADIETATAPRTMNINERSSKADIIDAAVELTSTQAEKISELQQQQTILLILLGVLTICQLL
jgi:hypothetical protein